MMNWKPEKLVASLFAGAMFVLMTSPALACRIPIPRPPASPENLARFAEAGLRAATFVDVAVAVSATPYGDVYPGYDRSLSVIDFEVVHSLQAEGVRRFQLQGIYGITAIQGNDLLVRGLPPHQSPYGSATAPTPDPDDIIVTSCGLSDFTLSALPGRSYLIFRNAEGRLVNHNLTYNYRPLNSDDPWLRAVVIASRR